MKKNSLKKKTNFTQLNVVDNYSYYRGKNDCLLSLSASGETLFTCSAIVEAKKNYQKQQNDLLSISYASIN